MKVSWKVTTFLSLTSAVLLALSSEPARSSILGWITESLRPVAIVLFTVIPSLSTYLAAHRNPDGGPAGAPYRNETRETVCRSRADRHSNLIGFTWEEALVLSGMSPKSSFARMMPMILKGDPMEAPFGGLLHTALVCGDPLVIAVQFLDDWTANWQSYQGAMVQVPPGWQSLDRSGKIRLIREKYLGLGSDFLGLISYELAKTSSGAV